MISLITLQTSDQHKESIQDFYITLNNYLASAFKGAPQAVNVMARELAAATVFGKH